MARFLDPKNDLTFKRVFGEHKHLCMSLLNSMLPLERPVVSIEYQTGELIPVLANVLRNTIVDVRCTDAAGRQFLVEMQLFWSDIFKYRVLFNASKAYVMQFEKGQQISLAKPVYALSFVNETFDHSPGMEEEYYHHYKIVNIKDTEKQIEGLEFVFIELPKFKPQNRAEKRLHDLWLRFLTEINDATEEVPAELLENDLTREAVKHMEVAAYNKAQLLEYDQWRLDTWTAVAMVDHALVKGEAIGLEKGEVIGLGKGEVIGEQKTQRQVVLNSSKAGLSVETIATITGLSVEQTIEILESK